MTLTVGSLFSGIGGIDLGLERAGMKIVWQSEIEPFACRILAKHWPTVPNIGDAAVVDWSEVEQPDVVAGGFPCQPVSAAGVKRAQADKRWLWPLFASAVRHLRPRYVIVENVVGLLSTAGGRAAQEVFGDLAELGYDAEWASIPAAAVGAPLLRYRIFIVARRDVAEPEILSIRPRLRPDEPASQRWGRLGDLHGPDRVRPCPSCGEDWCEWHLAHRADCGCSDPWDESEDPDFGWWATEPGVGRMVDGLPYRLDRLRCLGNAVVPQVAEYVGRRLAALIDGEADG
jgi:DNA (cytosine-5)-methyltransferase 1